MEKLLKIFLLVLTFSFPLFGLTYSDIKFNVIQFGAVGNGRTDDTNVRHCIIIKFEYKTSFN